MREASYRIHIHPLLLFGVALVAGHAWAGVATLRLSTGLTATGTAEGLPEAWVAPVDVAPVIDGRLDEDAWSQSPPIVLGQLESRGRSEPRSEARLVVHGRTLHVGLKLMEPNPDRMRRSVTQTDGPAYQDDSVEIFLSPFPDREYCQFIVSCTGAIYDRQGHGNPAAFNAGATAAVAVNGEIWSVEIAIPMDALGIGDKIPTRWRANIYRNRYAGTESQSQAWSPTLRGDYDVPERFGHLLFTPASPWAEREQAAGRKQGIEIREIDKRGAVLLFDLSSLPKGTRVYRARLLCERRPVDLAAPQPPGPIEILPLRSPYQEGEAPQIDAKPLLLEGPWFRSFDMTDLVQEWIRGTRPNHGVYVKDFPGWRREKTCLDIMYEGEGGQVPPQATGVRASHRAGQTFVTWKEISDPVGRDRVTWGQVRKVLDDLHRRREIRYCVYRFSKPITAERLHEAERIAVVEPLSCWNLNGRNIARPIDEFIANAKVLNWHQWNPFRDASVDGEYGRDCPIDRFVIQGGQAPLARGTGLYVHTAARKERAYYAVVTCVDGIENTIDIGPANAPPDPVIERVAEPEPVLQGELPKGPFFNYDQRRLHYVRWVGPPYSNKPYEYFNWSVGVPSELGGRVPLELNLHRDGYAYWRTHYRIEPGSIVLCPHDFPLKTWWYGYHEAQGNLKPWNTGVIRNYTEKRLLSFVEWTTKKWPVDRNRILVTGCNGGASGGGALHLGLRHPGVFNMVIAGHGEANYKGAGADVEKIWGRVRWNLKAESGRSIWDELDLVRHVETLPATTDLPFVSMSYSGNQKTADALAETLMNVGQPVITHTAWGGQRMVPVSATATNWCVPLDIRKNRSLLAVRASGKVGDAVRNASLLWQPQNLVDEPDKYAVTLRQASGTFEGMTTLRRLQKFQVVPGKRYRWKLESLETPSAGRREKPVSQDGLVTIGKDGLLQITDAKIPTGAYRLTIAPDAEELP